MWLSPQHRDCPAVFENCVDSFKSLEIELQEIITVAKRPCPRMVWRRKHIQSSTSFCVAMLQLINLFIFSEIFHCIDSCASAHFFRRSKEPTIPRGPGKYQNTSEP